MGNNDPIRLTTADFYTPRVEGYLEEQAVINRAGPEVEPQPLILRILYSSCFYLSIAGMVGALAVWAVFEPFIKERADEQPGPEAILGIFFFFPAIVAGIGVSLGLVEGLVCRNPMRALTSAVVGLGIGFIGGCVTYFVAHWLFVVTTLLAYSVGPPDGENEMPRRFGLLIFIMGRATAWAIASTAAGVCQGIALREKKVVVNGVIGAAIGGLLGGLLFDPIAMLVGGETGTVSRAIGLAVIGIAVGLFIGLVENWSKSAWLLMRAGPLAGKQFILFRNPTVIGSSPKADIYLFKDAAIEPQHALIYDRGGRFELEDVGTAKGTFINGKPTRKKFLEPGDQIALGQTVLEFDLRDKE